MLNNKLRMPLYTIMTGYLGFAKGVLGANDTFHDKFYKLAAGTIAIQKEINASRLIPRSQKKRVERAERIMRNPPRPHD
jgi:hypothetical protein